jgi:DNA-binding response OmpR family regulator
MRILVVEDNKKIAKYTARALESVGYAVDVVHDGMQAESTILSGAYDLVVLDIMLPSKDGVSICVELRTQGILVPIILVTAKDTITDRITGLDSGADDYLVKPFAVEELLARVRSLLRRPVSYVGDVLHVQDVTIDVQTRTVSRNGDDVPVTLKEFVVLEYLVRNSGVVVTRQQLIEHCWDFAYDAMSNITDVYIKQLRKKLHDTDEKYIKTIRGTGYMFKV